MIEGETQLGHAPLVENRETEPGRSRIVIYGFPHHELNLEGVPHIVNTFRAGLETHPRKATLFLETHYLSEANARHWENLVGALGGLTNLRIAQLIAETGSKLPDREEIEAKRRTLETSELIELVATGVLPPKYVLPIYEAREIDALRREYPFEIAFESHPPQVARTLEGMQTGSNELRSSAFNHFAEKDFEGMLSDYKSYIQLEHMIKSTRHRFNLADLRRRIAADGQGSFIFVVAGASHLVLADQLKASLPKEDTTEIEAVSNIPYTEHPEHKLHQALNQDETPGDLLYAQDFIEGIFGMEVLNRYDAMSEDKNRPALSAFAHHFEAIDAAVQRMATSLSLDEIREMCVDYDKVHQYLEQSPHAKPVRMFMFEPAQTHGYRAERIEHGARRQGVSTESFELPEADILRQFVDNKTLSPRDAQMLHLHYREKLPFDKVSERLNLSQNTIRQYMPGALSKLPEEVRRQLRGS